MNIKDKIAICLVIISVIVLAILVRSDAEIMGQSSSRAIADYAKNNLSDFLNTPVDQSWFSQELDSGYETIARSSATCLYEQQGWKSGANYRATNIIDIKWNEGTNKYDLTGYWNGGHSALGIVSGNEGKVEAFAQAVYRAYNVTYSNDYTTTEKSAMKSLFYQAIKDGGFLIDGNGVLNIDESFIQTWNGESEGYQNGTDYTAQDLINEYNSNTHVGYGITQNQTENTTKTKDADNNYTIFGPFNLSFSTPISEVIIRGKNGENLVKECSSNNFEIKFSEYAGIDDSGWISDIRQIPSNTNFYIKISDSDNTFFDGSPQVSVEFKQETIQVYQARFILLAVADGSGQNLMIYAADRKDYNSSITVNVEQGQKYVDLTVVKSGDNNVAQANVSFNLLNGVTGMAHAHWGSKTEENGVNIYSDITFKEWTNEENQIFTTGSSGKFIVKGLDTSYTYSLQETSNPNAGYTTVDIKGATLSNGTASVKISNTDSNNNSNKNQVTDIKLSSTQGNTLYIVDRNDKEEYFDINITKTDTSGKSNLEGAEFRIKVYDGADALGWLRQTSTGEYEYDSSYSSSTIWSTTVGNTNSDSIVYAESKGKISVAGLSRDYRYQIYETKQASGYIELRYQITNGMKVKVDSKTTSETKFIEGANRSTESNDYAATDDSIYCATVSYSGNGSDVDISISNYKRTPGGGGGNNSGDDPTIKISGFIWIDTENGKDHVYNEIYESGNEELYKGSVKISLINSNDRTVRTVTTESGSYTINTGIKIPESASDSTVASRLSGYYLKFEYDNSYSTVAPKFTEQNGSKALINDKDGEAYIYNLNDFIEQFYSNYTLQYMNLGLVETGSADFDISQNIAYIKVAINGYTYTYEYAGTDEKINTAAPTVEFSKGYAYEKPIYPSDIAYSVGKWNDSNSLRVYVVYRIDITNSNDTNANINRNTVDKRIEYAEIDMKVTNLVNNYDKDTYVLETDYDSSENEDFADWEDNNNDGKATYTGNKLDNTIIPNKMVTIYNEYRVKDEALEELLTVEERYDRIMTTASATAYHNYWKSYYTWPSDRGTPVLITADRRTSDQTKNASAYYLKLRLSTERIITGKVFKDENIYNTGEIIGSGFYDSNESAINNVTVELITEDGTNQAVLYNKAENYVGKPAISYSSTDGTYSFVGVTPGKYYIRFTYGDGTQKICEFNNGTFTETDQTISLENYKSTIVSDPWAKAALGYKDSNFEFENEKERENWYKKVAGTNYNVAVDDFNQREGFNADKSSRNNIAANTALTSISVENTEEDYVTITKEDNGTKETISGMNFGIIEIPKIELAFDKVVSNIQITNSQGNIIADGNPTSQDLSDMISNLDFTTNHLVTGSNYVRAEINEQELYGSTLRLEYSITIQNNSEVNYYENKEGNSYYGYYYKFGDRDHSTEATITIDEVIDFLDPSIEYETIDDDHEARVIQASNYQNLTNNIQTETELTYDTLVSITRKTPVGIYTTKHTRENGERVYSSIDDTQKTTKLTAARLLSADQDDLGVVNVAQVTQLHVTDNPELIETTTILDSSKALVEAQNTRYFGPTNPTGEIEVIITPPTGEDRYTVVFYAMIEVIALLTITGGVILIKKKVLHK